MPFFSSLPVIISHFSSKIKLFKVFHFISTAFDLCFFWPILLNNYLMLSSIGFFWTSWNFHFFLHTHLPPTTILGFDFLSNCLNLLTFKPPFLRGILQIVFRDNKLHWWNHAFQMLMFVWWEYSMRIYHL